MKVYLFLSTLLFSLSVFSETCSSVNLVTQDKSPFKQIPVYDQDGIGACYAYSGAQLMDYYLLKNGKKTTRSVHPAWVALKYTKAQRKNTITGGSVRDAITATRSSGNCDYSKVSEALGKYAKLAKVTEAEMLDILESFSLEAEKELKQNSFMKPLLLTKPVLGQDLIGKPINYSTRQYNYKETQRILDKVLVRYKKATCSVNMDYEKLVEALSPLIDFTTNQMMTAILFPTCFGLKTNEFPNPKHTSFKQEQDVTKNIIEQLSFHKAPSGISYCASIWSNPDYPGVVTRPYKTGKDCGNHASIVVGMKPVGNKCHFLVRNTWGSGFSSSTSKWKCLCKHKKTGKFVDDCTNKTHNNGQYTVEGCWMGSDKLSKNVYQTTVLN